MGKNTIEIKLYSNKDGLEKGFRELAERAKNKRAILRELSQAVMEYIGRAFDTEGKSMGEKWEDWSERYYQRVRKKIGGSILTKEGDLRKSISRKINRDTAIIFTDKEYGAIHNFGMDFPNKIGINPNMPKRTYMDFTEDLTNELETILWGELKIDEVERQIDARIRELKGE